MRYIKVHWIHNFEDEPVFYYHELGDNGFEIRKIVIYKDGHIEKASEQHANESAYLSSKPIPGIVEINSDSQFVASEITAHEFEAKWLSTAG